MLEKARYIVIEGPIGPADPRSLGALNERLAATPVLEQPELNPVSGPFLPGHGTLGPADTARISLSSASTSCPPSTDRLCSGSATSSSTRIRFRRFSTFGR